MFIRSRYTTRLLVRCPNCHQYASVNLDAWTSRQTFCSYHGTPMIVVGCATGPEPSTGDWPHLVDRRAITLAEAGLSPMLMVPIGRCPCVPEGELAVV